ncbi:hypothetical protein IF1G_05766 [Cordyceps javanica]|uniref:Uncharacterized protein n=1 Tax=Cordyceps javanica TaxID=43265 RepID=A0A545V2K4_9HYPO|nr:hypothetical protein IF1G_05766 [Cordyceps javanica]
MQTPSEIFGASHVQTVLWRDHLQQKRQAGFPNYLPTAPLCSKLIHTADRHTQVHTYVQTLLPS